MSNDEDNHNILINIPVVKATGIFVFSDCIKAKTGDTKVPVSALNCILKRIHITGNGSRQQVFFRQRIYRAVFFCKSTSMEALHRLGKG